MPSSVCDWCNAYITSSNTQWPGYCRTTCRDRARRTHANRKDARRLRRTLAEAEQAGDQAASDAIKAKLILGARR